MGHTIPRALLLATLTMLLALPLAAPARAAAPRFLMVYGTALARPVVLADWRENLDLMLAITEPATVTSEELARRPYLELAFFWGYPWNDYAASGKPVEALRPEQANQHGRFYPAFGTAEPVVTFDSIPGPGALERRVEPQGLAILTRYGIPTRLEPGSSLPVGPTTPVVEPANQPLPAAEPTARFLAPPGVAPLLAAILLAAGTLGASRLVRRRA